MTLPIPISVLETAHRGTITSTQPLNVGRVETGPPTFQHSDALRGHLEAAMEVLEAEKLMES